MSGLYDLEITRRDDERTSVGYLLDWDTDAPMRVSTQPPELPVSTSTGVAEGGDTYSGRDAAPPYPIELNNWQDGAGQPSYDKKDASPDAFAASRGIDVSDEGHFELGPRAFAYVQSTIGNRAIHALGTFWASFVPAGADPRDSVRYLVRYPVTASQAAEEYLGTTGATSLTVADGTGLTDITGAVPASDVAAGDYLYCPVHNEIVKVASIVSSTNFIVTRASCGTTAAAHTAGERWYALGWRSVTFTGTNPAESATAFCTDGAKVYAAFYSGSGANGSVWSGTTGAWTKFGDIQQVKELAYCAGYLYAAQDNVGGHSSVLAIESDGTTTHLASAAGGIAPNVTTAGLVTLGNYVYWAVTDGYSRSWVYRIQYSAGGTVFELAAEMPDGFVATSLCSALSNLYVGGYVDTLVTDADNAGDVRYHAYLYLVTASEVSVACKWNDPVEDCRITALVAGGPYVYMLTPNDVRVYSTEHGGWWHVADVSSSSATVTGTPLNWTTSGFDYTVATKKPTATGAILTTYDAWEDGTTGYVLPARVVADSSTSSGFTDRLVVGLEPSMGYQMSVNAKKYYRFTLDGLPDGGYGTLETRISDAFSQAGALCMAGASREARVYVRGVLSSGVKYARIGLRYCEPSDTSAYAGTRWTGNIPLSSRPTVRLTMDPVAGAKVYVNGGLALTSSANELLAVTGTDATKVWFSCGWPGDPQSDTNGETITLDCVRFTGSGAYPPDYVPSVISVTTDCIAFGEGRLLIPAPALVASYIEPKENCGTGWLRTSESGLHMGTVDKYFTTAEVIHSPLKSGQTVTISPYVDGVVVGSTSVTGPSLDVSATTSTAAISRSGKRLSVIVALSDTDNDRRSDDHLRVSSVTGRFFPANSATLHTFVLNCREGAQTRSGIPWSHDPDEAIRHAFTVAESGEVVDVSCLWGDFAGRVEELDLVAAPADRTRYDALCGVLRMKVRSYE